MLLKILKLNKREKLQLKLLLVIMKVSTKGFLKTYCLTWLNKGRKLV